MKILNRLKRAYKAFINDVEEVSNTPQVSYLVDYHKPVILRKKITISDYDFHNYVNRPLSLDLIINDMKKELSLEIPDECFNVKMYQIDTMKEIEINLIVNKNE